MTDEASEAERELDEFVTEDGRAAVVFGDVSGKSVEEVSREIIFIASATPAPPPARRSKKKKSGWPRVSNRLYR